MSDKPDSPREQTPMNFDIWLQSDGEAATPETNAFYNAMGKKYGNDGSRLLASLDLARSLERRLQEAQRELTALRDALTESVKLQSHYAELLNMHDGGERTTFTVETWLARLAALAEKGQAMSDKPGASDEFREASLRYIERQAVERLTDEQIAAMADAWFDTGNMDMPNTNRRGRHRIRIEAMMNAMRAAQEGAEMTEPIRVAAPQDLERRLRAALLELNALRDLSLHLSADYEGAWYGDTDLDDVGNIAGHIGHLEAALDNLREELACVRLRLPRDGV